MKTTPLPKKKVKLSLAEIDSNAYMLMGAFSRAARRQGWTDAEREAVLTECKAGDYDHLLQTLMEVCEDEDAE